MTLNCDKLLQGAEVHNMNDHLWPDFLNTSKPLRKLSEAICDNKDQNFEALMDEFEFPVELRKIYSRVDTTEEIRYKSWIFESPKYVMDRRPTKQNHFIDVGYTYLGMGHVAVLCWDKSIKKYFLRSSDGASGWDALVHEKYFIRLPDMPGGFNLQNDLSKTFDSNTLINNIIDLKEIIEIRKHMYDPADDPNAAPLEKKDYSNEDDST